MNTKATLQVFQALGIGISVFILLESPFGFTGSIVCSFLGTALLGYAWFREAALDDKSESLSPRYVGLVLGGLALWVAFVFVRASIH